MLVSHVCVRKHTEKLSESTATIECLRVPNHAEHPPVVTLNL